MVCELSVVLLSRAILVCGLSFCHIAELDAAGCMLQCDTCSVQYALHQLSLSQLQDVNCRMKSVRAREAR